MSNQQKTVTLCRYWVKSEKEAEFRDLLEKHWPTFTKLGLVAESPPHLIFRGEDRERGVFYVEVFPWKDIAATERAHSLPEVASIWEPMSDCCTPMEFSGVEEVQI